LPASDRFVSSADADRVKMSPLRRSDRYAVAHKSRDIGRRAIRCTFISVRIKCLRGYSSTIRLWKGRELRWVRSSSRN